MGQLGGSQVAVPCACFGFCIRLVYGGTQTRFDWSWFMVGLISALTDVELSANFLIFLYILQARIFCSQSKLLFLFNTF